MELTDRIYLIEEELDIFGEQIPVSESSLDCRVMSRHLIIDNSQAGTK